MRSIGQRNIKKLKATVLLYFDTGFSEEDIVGKMPSKWWDIWEGADAEIHRLVSDELMNLNGAEADNDD